MLRDSLHGRLYVRCDDDVFLELYTWGGIPKMYSIKQIFGTCDKNFGMQGCVYHRYPKFIKSVEVRNQKAGSSGPFSKLCQCVGKRVAY